MDGCFGKYADVDLSTGVTADYRIPEAWLEKHVGGRGIATRILLEELHGGEDPLGPENVLVFATGPYQGTNTPGGGKHGIYGRSPKTGTINESYAGGFFGHALGRSGYDGIIVRGVAESPRSLIVQDGEVELTDATDLWGLETADVESRLKELHGNVSVSSIGIAGENGVQSACIVNDRARALGRSGWGAVMGSKRLKAIAVGGDQEKPIHDPEALRSDIAAYRKYMRSRQDLAFYGETGTINHVRGYSELGVLPTKNFQEGCYDFADDISDLGLAPILVRRDTCAGCPVACKRVVRTSFQGRPVEERYGGPEFEAAAAFGSLCLNRDIHSICMANQLCNRYGLDTISAGNMIAFIMEATEKGLLSEHEGARWGDAGRIVELVEQIARREGIGAKLANGLAAFARELGAEEFAMHIKGQEIPMHEPRGKIGLGISYATSPRGATHLDGMHDHLIDTQNPLAPWGVVDPVDRFAWEPKPRLDKLIEDLFSFSNSLVCCLFIHWGYSAGHPEQFEYDRAILLDVTGRDLPFEEWQLIGERNYVIRKIMSAWDGYTRADDDLPPRFKTPLPRGGSAGRPITDRQLQAAIDEWYELRGFDSCGPTDAKLAELGLGELRGLIRRDA